MAFIDLRDDLPWLRGERVHVVPREREADLRAALARRGFAVHTLDGARIRDEGSFFEEAARGLPLPNYFGGNWDAWNDSLGELIAEREGGIAVIWQDAGALAAADPQTLLDALLGLDSAGLWSGSEEADGAQLEVFLLGLGR